ncbi:MAG: hypothetical protein DRR08_08760 [Candidatus Parabeggiatoa sp. nov. 2]|nr:MAG: hypothetical protein B6247_22730 [Beggiatoa sp. 4572_84]RKZ61426.1 MAG: hypothetical protein DRR08_08760 [Gammaproteobacteria bacterium]
MERLRCGLRTVLWMTLVMGLSWFPVAWADLNAGLVAHYPFDGNAQDASENGHHGTVQGATLTMNRFGKTNKAFSFYGNYIRVIENSAFDLSNFTYSTWINANRSNGWRSIIDIDNDKQLLALYNGQYVVYGRCGNHRHGTVTGGWHHVVWTVSAQHYTLYVDGNIIGTNKTCSSNVDGSNLMIGSGWYRSAGNEYFDGKIDEVRVYNRALPECEIKSLYTGKNECKPMLVTLNNFTATPFQNAIRVHWITASEVDNAGFYILRATGEGWRTGDYSQVIRITDQLIPSKGTKVGGYPYSYVDSNVESGITYYYGLEDIDVNGQSTVHFDVIDEATAE